MAEYDNTNSGALFRNKDKDEAHPNWADYQGSINVEGAEYWLSAWLKTSKNGARYMSLSVRPKGERSAKAAPSADEKPFNDDIPF